MKRAVRVCERLTAEQVEAALTRTEIHYVLPPGDFLSEEQDVRGLPLSLCREYEKRHKGRPRGMDEEFTIKKKRKYEQTRDDGCGWRV